MFVTRIRWFSLAVAAVAGSCLCALLAPVPVHGQEEEEAAPVAKQAAPRSFRTVAGDVGNQLYQGGPASRPGEAFGAQFRIGHVTGPAVGREQSITPLEFMPYGFLEDTMFFGDFRGFRSNSGRYGANAGGGIRHYLRNRDHILGANFYYDYDETSGALFRDIGFGLESLGRNFDLRANAYFPQGSTSQLLSSRVAPDSLRYSGNNLLFDRIRTLGVAPMGGDVEGGIPIRGEFMESHDVRVFGGAYHYQSKDLENPIWGWKSRIQGNIIPSVGVQLELTHDQVFKTTLSFAAYWTFGGWKRPDNARPSQFDRMTTPVRRNYNVVVAQQDVTDAGIVATNPTTGAAYFFEHVSNNPATVRDPAATQGTYENPWLTLQQAKGNKPTGDPLLNPNVDIILVHANSSYSTAPDNQVILNQPVRILGEADNIVHQISLAGLTADQVFQPLPRATFTRVNPADPTSAFAVRNRPVFLNVAGDAINVNPTLASTSGASFEFSGFQFGQLVTRDTVPVVRTNVTAPPNVTNPNEAGNNVTTLILNSDAQAGPTGNGVTLTNLAANATFRYLDIFGAGGNGVSINNTLGAASPTGSVRLDDSRIAYATGNGLQINGGRTQVNWGDSNPFVDTTIPGDGLLPGIFNARGLAVDITNTLYGTNSNMSGLNVIQERVTDTVTGVSSGGLRIRDSAGGYTFGSITLIDPFSGAVLNPDPAIELNNIGLSTLPSGSTALTQLRFSGPVTIQRPRGDAISIRALQSQASIDFRLATSTPADTNVVTITDRYRKGIDYRDNAGITNFVGLTRIAGITPASVSLVTDANLLTGIDFQANRAGGGLAFSQRARDTRSLNTLSLVSSRGDAIRIGGETGVVANSLQSRFDVGRSGTQSTSISNSSSEIRGAITGDAVRIGNNTLADSNNARVFFSNVNIATGGTSATDSASLLALTGGPATFIPPGTTDFRTRYANTANLADSLAQRGIAIENPSNGTSFIGTGTGLGTRIGATGFNRPAIDITDNRQAITGEIPGTRGFVEFGNVTIAGGTGGLLLPVGVGLNIDNSAARTTLLDPTTGLVTVRGFGDTTTIDRTLATGVTFTSLTATSAGGPTVRVRDGNLVIGTGGTLNSVGASAVDIRNSAANVGFNGVTVAATGLDAAGNPTNGVTLIGIRDSVIPSFSLVPDPAFRPSLPVAAVSGGSNFTTLGGTIGGATGSGFFANNAGRLTIADTSFTGNGTFFPTTTLLPNLIETQTQPTLFQIAAADGVTVRESTSLTMSGSSTVIPVISGNQQYGIRARNTPSVSIQGYTVQNNGPQGTTDAANIYSEIFLYANNPSSVLTTGATTYNFNLYGNTIADQGGSGISITNLVAPGGTLAGSTDTSLNATVTNNFITLTGANSSYNNSISSLGSIISGVQMIWAGPTLTATISNNLNSSTIFDATNQTGGLFNLGAGTGVRGILVDQRLTTGNIELLVDSMQQLATTTTTTNNVTTVTNTFTAGIIGTGAQQVGVDVRSSNSATSNTASGVIIRSNSIRLGADGNPNQGAQTGLRFNYAGDLFTGIYNNLLTLSGNRSDINGGLLTAVTPSDPNAPPLSTGIHFRRLGNGGRIAVQQNQIEFAGPQTVANVLFPNITFSPTVNNNYGLFFDSTAGTITLLSNANPSFGANNNVFYGTRSILNPPTVGTPQTSDFIFQGAGTVSGTLLINGRTRP